MANQFCRWDPGLKIACLRFSNVMYEEEYAEFPSFDADAAARKWNLWGYIDARDGAQAIRKAIETEFTGAEAFIIANADTVMSRPNAELVAEQFPGVDAARRRRRHRDAAVDRQGPARARLRARVHLARLGGLSLDVLRGAVAAVVEPHAADDARQREQAVRDALARSA